MTDNTDLIRALYAAFRRGDVNFILANLDPSIEWVSNGDGSVIPWGGRRGGVVGAASFFQLLSENLDFEVFEPRIYLDAGDVVTVLGRTRARLKRGGGAFESEWAHVFTIRDGKLARFQEFYDSAAIVAAIAA